MRARNKQKLREWKISIRIGIKSFALSTFARTYGSACRQVFRAIRYTPKSTPEGGFEGVSGELL